MLPGAINYGWFFRYLTFCSLTIQVRYYFPQLP